MSLPFSESAYLKRYPDVAAAVTAGGFPSGYAHWLQYGAKEGRIGMASTSVDKSWYLKSNPDVAANGMDAEAHYLTYGQFEGRDPNAYFNQNLYSQLNPDVAAAVSAGQFRTAYDHFIEFGQQENRPLGINYNETAYLERNADVKAAVKSGVFSSGWEHYLLYGHAESRSTTNFVALITRSDGSLNVVGSSAADYIFGSDGNDILDGGRQSAFSSTPSGNDWITGGAGNDTINGDGGYDTLTGGAGQDQFVLYARGGSLPEAFTATVTDFQPGVDQLYIPMTSAASAADLLANAEQRGDDLFIKYFVPWVSWGTGPQFDSVTLKNVQLSAMSASDFSLGSTGASGINAASLAIA